MTTWQYFFLSHTLTVQCCIQQYITLNNSFSLVHYLQQCVRCSKVNSDFISCVHILQERKVSKLYKGRCCVHQSCYIQQTECFNKAFDKITSNLFGTAVMKTTTNSAGNILLQYREISTYFISCVLRAWKCCVHPINSKRLFCCYFSL